MQLDRALLHDSKRQTYDQTKKCAETLLLLGQVSETLSKSIYLIHSLTHTHTQTHTHTHTHTHRLTEQCSYYWKQTPLTQTTTLMHSSKLWPHFSIMLSCSLAAEQGVSSCYHQVIWSLPEHYKTGRHQSHCELKATW